MRHHIHLATHAEFWQVNAGFYRETGVRQDLPVVFGFEIVEIRAIAVDGVGDGVSGAMHEVFAVALARDEVSHRLVDLPATNLFA